MSRIRIQPAASGDASTSTEPARLRVAIADDHPAYRGQLAIFLRDRGLDVVGEVGNGHAAIELAEAADPDVVLMDLRMPLLSGFEAIRRLDGAPHHCRVLALSAAALQDEIADAILLGANGHVFKDQPQVELLWALRAIAAGRPLLSPGTAQVLLRRIRGDADPRSSLADASMVRRELDLLACLAQSYTAIQIGIALSATPDEVNDEIEVILMKLRSEGWIGDHP